MKGIIERWDIKPSFDGMPKEYSLWDQKYVMVPDVTGMTLDEAKNMLKSFTLTYSGNGQKILYQSPKNGMYIKENGTISLMLTEGE